MIPEAGMPSLPLSPLQKRRHPTSKKHCAAFDKMLYFLHNDNIMIIEPTAGGLAV